MSRLQVRLILAGVFLASLTAGSLWLGAVKIAASREQALARQVEDELGGSCAPDPDCPRLLVFSALGHFEDPQLHTLRDICGPRLSYIDLGGTQITDVGLNHLRDLHQLRRLHLEGTAVSDTGLKQLCALKSLRSLGLRETNVTADVLPCFPRLRWLTLKGCAIDDNGALRISELRELQVLDISNTHVTSQGLRHLRQLKNLRRLSLEGCQVSRKEIEELIESLPNLHAKEVFWDEPLHNLSASGAPETRND